LPAARARQNAGPQRGRGALQRIAALQAWRALALGRGSSKRIQEVGVSAENRR
jgi:hypothetical protein